MRQWQGNLIFLIHKASNGLYWRLLREMTTNLIHKVTEIREMRTEDAHIHTNMHHTHKDYGRWFESVAVEWWELNSTDQTRGGSRASRRNEELWLKLSSAAESAALTVRCRNRIAGLNSEEKSQGDPVTVLHFAIIWKYTVCRGLTIHADELKK